MLESLKSKSVRDTTAKNYLKIWRHFNKFLIKLDRRPDNWEDRVTLYVTYLIDKGNQSSTVKSYISAIKKTLSVDGYIWNEDKALLNSLTKACKLVNDTVKT